MKKGILLLCIVMLSGVAYADETKMEKVRTLFNGNRTCPLPELEQIFNEAPKAVEINTEASYISENGDTYLIVVGRSLQDCPAVVQYLLENGADKTLYHKDEQAMMAMNYFETDYIHYEEQPGKHKGNKSAQLLLSYIDNPSYRLLNHTFWRNTTEDDLSEILLEADLDRAVAAYTDWGKTVSLYVVDFALESARSELVLLLLEHEPPLDRQNEEGTTPLMRAAKYYNTDIIARIIELAPETVDVRDAKKYSALNYAELCTDGGMVCNPEKSRLILDAMDDPTAKMLSYTYWRYATLAQVKADIAAGADINASVVTELGEQPILWFAVTTASDYNVIQVLFDNKVQKSYGTTANNIFDTVNYYRIYSDQDKMINFLMKNGIKKP